MSGHETILCAGEFTQVSILDDYNAADVQTPHLDNKADGLKQNDRQKQQLTQACQTINSIIARLDKFSSQKIAEYKRQTVELAVHIAEKIIAESIKQDKYNITEIITKAIDHAPAAEEITVLLGNDDFEVLSQLQQKGELKELSGVQLKVDNNLGKAECRVMTPKGMVNSIIKEHLERIGKAMEQVC